MPISEDEFNQYSNDSFSSSTMSKAELRKTHKPIMEKRRRAKINNCLNEIKHLILAAMKKDPERHSKLEKADILEMAVKHLKNIQRQQRDMAIRTDPTVAKKFKSGFTECADEVSTFVSQLEGVDPAMKQRITAHLSKCSNTIEPPVQFPFTSAFAPSSSLLASFAQNRYHKTDDDQNNNARIQGIELIPSCLPTGEFAFLVPKSSFSTILSSQLGEDRPSAFVTVTSKPSDRLLKISKPLSPPMSPTSSEDMQSPRGFKPVHSKSETMVSSSTIHSMKYPIHNVKKENMSEPLCIITNSTERFRQAHVLEDTQHSSENVYHGFKRRFRDDSQHGLLTVAAYEPPRKIFKSEIDVPTSSSQTNKKDNKDSDSDNKSNDSMWRPW